MSSKFFNCLVFIGILQPCLALETKLLRGSEIAPHVQEISSFFNATYREAPYFYDASVEKWDGYVQSYADTDKAVVCLVQEGEIILGAAMGTPLAEAREKYRMGFARRPEDLKSLFYLGEFAIKSDYRRQGIGTKMYQAFERAAAAQGLSGICFWQLESAETAPADSFWKKQQFEQRPDIHFDELWKDLSGAEKVPHRMICWMKITADQ
jgi:GNAT superfamily N-acetyltransferase